MRAALKPLSVVAQQQPEAVQQLRRAQAAGRRGSAYLLLGAQLAAALRLAEALCQTLMCTAAPAGRPNGDACGQCPGCVKTAQHGHPDVHWLSPNDKGSIAIDAVRLVCQRLGLVAHEAPVKVVLVSAAHALAPAAQNALLKTLEEPSGDTLFLLLARNRSSVLPTLASRCQSIFLRPLPLAAALERLGQAGVDPALAVALAEAMGDDVDLAIAWQEAGAADTLTKLLHVQNPRTPLGDVFQAVADMSRDKAQFDMALLLLEILVRNSLAHALGAPIPTQAQHLRFAAAPKRAALLQVAEQLTRWRRHQAFNLNRSLALGGLVLSLRASPSRITA